MNKCTVCGHENNDGAVCCLNCKTQLTKSDKLSDYNIYMQNQKRAEIVQRKITRSIIGIIIAIMVFAIAGFFVFAIRYKTAPSRAETLVCDYIKFHVSNVEQVAVSVTTGSCLKDNYFRSNGFWIMGNVVIDGINLSFTAEVDMNGIFDSGEIISIQINSLEIYR